MTTCAIYARISDDKKNDSHGVGSQTNQCRAYADDRGWTVTREYVDNDLSAYSGVNRPEFEQLIKDMAAGNVQRLIIWHVDRLCRRVSDLARVLKAAREGHTDIHTIKAGDIDLGNASGELMAYMLGAVAQFEARHISERVTASHAARVEEGRWRGAGRPPFGYDTAGGGMLKINEDEAESLKEWAKRILAGDTLLAIKRTERDRGRDLAATTIRRRLINPNIAGLATFKGKITGPAVWPAILDEDTWRDVEAILNDPRRRTTQGSQRKYQGGGVYRCGKCGGKMKATNGRSGGKRPHKGAPAYTCRECYGVQRKIDKVDEVVDDVIVGYLSNLDNRITVAQGNATDGVDVNALRDNRARLIDRKDRMGSMYAEGLIDDAQLVEGTRKIRDELDKIEGKLEQARDSSPIMSLALEEGDIRERWASLSPDKRAEIIDLLLVVTIQKSTKRGPHFDPESITFEWK